MNHFHFPLLIVATLVLTSQCFAQGLSDQDGQRGGSCIVMNSKAVETYRHPTLPGEEDPVFKRDRFAVLTSAMVSALGPGGKAVLSMPESDGLLTQFSTGYIMVPGQQYTNLTGGTVLGAVIPVFYGWRYNLLDTETSQFQWKQYAVAGGGPVLGLEYSNTFGFFRNLMNTGFRWGAGAYAGIGSELRFGRSFGAFMQLELDAMHFLSPHLGRTNYIGPSFSFGFHFGLR